MRTCFGYALIAVPLLCAPAPDAEAQRLERLTALGKQWGLIRTQHPDLATRRIDWDRALLEAIASVNRASSPGDWADAVSTMLSRLSDPASSLGMSPAPSLVAAPQDLRPCTWLGDDTLLVHLNDVLRFQNTEQESAAFLAGLRKEVAKADRILFDLRPDKAINAMSEDDRLAVAWGLRNVFEGLMPELLPRPLALPAERVRIHLGYRGDVDTGYTNGVMLRSGKRYLPARAGIRKALAFLVNDQTPLPAEAMALHQAGLALLVSEGQKDRDWGTETRRFTLPGGLSGQSKVSDRVFENGSNECLPDETAAASPSLGAEAPGVAAILARWKQPQKPTASGLGGFFPVFQPDEAFADQPFPSREHRVLAAIKFWTTIDQFFPYKKLLDHPWEGRLRGFIQALEQTRDAQSYQLAVQAMVAQLQDSHGALCMAQGGFADEDIEPEGVRTFFGSGHTPVALAMIEGQPVVVRVWAKSRDGEGFLPGDVILKVDGEPAAMRMARFRPYLAASTPQRLNWKAANHLLRGPLGQTGHVDVRRANGALYPVKVTWSELGPVLKGQWRTGPEYRLLPGNIGYVDLDRLAPAQVQPMFDSLKATRGVILDLRGYPSGGGTDAAPMFLKRPNAIGSVVDLPVHLGDAAAEGYDASRNQAIYMAKDLGYQGKVIVLVDERAQSAAEYASLELEAGADATFVGSPTSGANGSVTTMVLPGALRVYFTGGGIRHADGRQLQRIGIQPNIIVRPTIQGIASGMDEVLERAHRFLMDGR